MSHPTSEKAQQKKFFLQDDGFLKYINNIACEIEDIPTAKETIRSISQISEVLKLNGEETSEVESIESSFATVACFPSTSDASSIDSSVVKSAFFRS